jgi:hypothetical protein
MAAKKKPTKTQTKSRQTKSNQTKSKRTTVSKMTRVKKTAKKKASVSKVARKRGAAKTQGTKRTAATTLIVPKPQVRRRKPTPSPESLREGPGARSGGQSGDLQGLSKVERADSESVRELLDEGNAFEAGVVTGVEDAGNADEREVHTHEVPEDDVPDEYQDKE